MGLMDSLRGAVSKARSNVDAAMGRSSDGAASGQSSGSMVRGILDPRVAPYRKVWISDPKAGVTLVGVYGKGTSQEVTASWNGALESFTPGQAMPAAGALAQAATGMTMVTELNMMRTWGSTEPTSITVELVLYAVRDARTEVMDVLTGLQQFMAPDLDQYLGAGSAPHYLALNIGGRVIYPSVCLASMSVPFDCECDSAGNFVRCTVNLTFTTSTVVTLRAMGEGAGIQNAYATIPS